MAAAARQGINHQPLLMAQFGWAGTFSQGKEKPNSPTLVPAMGQVPVPVGHSGAAPPTEHSNLLHEDPVPFPVLSSLFIDSPDATELESTQIPSPLASSPGANPASAPGMAMGSFAPEQDSKSHPPRATNKPLPAVCSLWKQRSRSKEQRTNHGTLWVARMEVPGHHHQLPLPFPVQAPQRGRAHSGRLIPWGIHEELQ